MMRVAAICAAFATSVTLAGGASAQSGVDQAEANNSVRAQLAEEGDDGRTPRAVEHWAYPVSSKSGSTSQLRKLLKNLGFHVDDANNGGLRFSHVTAVAGTDFDALTTRLTNLMIENGWEYDGWETVVVRKGNS